VSRAGSDGSERVLVTGASRGIGRAVVSAFVARGALVAAAARDRDALREVVSGAPDQVRPLVADLAVAAERDALVHRAVEAVGAVDVLVQCAGVARHAPIEELSEGDLRAQVEVNMIAPLLVARRAAAHMRSRRHAGSIVHLGSTLGIRPAPGAGAYAATKAGLASVTRTLAAELGPDGIRVNAIAPGLVDTDMVRTRRDAGPEELARLHPLGRLGTPEEIAAAVLHLVDEHWTTGTVRVVDGGLLAT